MTSSYLFYDIETTGLNKAFDQVLEFAAIRTKHKSITIICGQLCGIGATTPPI